MSQILHDSSQQAAMLLEQITQAFPDRTAGLAVRRVDEIHAAAKARFGWPGALVVFAIRLCLGVAVGLFVMAGFLWAIFGSLATFVAVGSAIAPRPDLAGLSIGFLAAVANLGLSLTAVAYVIHLLRPRPNRDVYGGAHFEDERSVAAKAGLVAPSRKDAKP
jgi:hypothetical protein